MRTLHAQTAKPLSVLAKKLIKLERTGRYEEGLTMFGEDWADPAFMPDTEHASAADAAEVMLRFGSLIGFSGYRNQTAGAQERSKNILTFARESYLALQNAAKTVECENHIALAYWRTGEYRESEIWVDEALSHDLPNSSDARLYAHLTKSLICLSEGRYEEHNANCLALEADFRAHGDAFLNGSLCANLGVSFKNIARNAEALRYFNLACSFHERSRHKTYLGIVHNNLAQLYRAERRFEMAHEAADAAIKVYKYVKDRTREASTIDTKAQIYLAEGKLPDALAAADRSIGMLRKSEISAYLAESLMTKAKVLIHLDDFPSAMFTLIEAVDLAKVQTGEEATIRLINEFEIELNRKSSPQPPEQANIGSLELVMPSSIANFDEYRGIWINCSRLENIGLTTGSLAIVAKAKINRGDLVAIAEFENDHVICGFYDADFGIVCLESGSGEPQLFNENDICILGKIVGVCNTGKDTNGKMVVEALKL